MHLWIYLGVSQNKGVSGTALEWYQRESICSIWAHGEKVFCGIFKTHGFCLYFFQMFENGEQRVPVYNRDYECTILFEQKMYL